MSVQERQALEGSRLPFFDPDPITYDWDRPIRDISLRYKLSYPLATVLIHAYFRSFTSYGVDNIPETGGFILAANHVSTYDPISVYYGMRGKRSMYIMAKEEFFHTFYTRWIFNHYHAFPVNRDHPDQESLRFSRRVIDEGQVLTLFPQGTRDLTHGKPSDFKPGAALLARECRADVLPVSIHLTEDASVKRPRCIVRYGEIIPYEELGFTEGKRRSKELRGAAQLIEDQVVSLWENDQI